MKTIVITTLAALLLAVASQVIADEAPAEAAITLAEICPV